MLLKYPIRIMHDLLNHTSIQYCYFTPHYANFTKIWQLSNLSNSSDLPSRKGHKYEFKLIIIRH